MKLDKKSMLLYVITDRTWLEGKPLSKAVEEAILGGATFVQMREKNLDYAEFLKGAMEVKTVTDRYKIPFVINDNVDVAAAAGCDGVHVGQSDEEINSARKKLGVGKIIGVSAGTVKEAVEAEKNGADYIGVGSIFNTSTKPDAKNVSREILKEICAAVSIPVVAIGGITKDNIRELSGTGIVGISVISAVFAQEDIKLAAGELLELTKQITGTEEDL